MSKPECNNPLRGHAYIDGVGCVMCCLCDEEMEWHECDCCCGEGGIDGYEEDPINYSPGEMIRCSECSGEGGFYFCENKKCPTVDAIKIHRDKAATQSGEKGGL